MKYFLSIICTLCIGMVKAQEQDTSRVLKEIRIRGLSLEKYSTGAKTEQINAKDIELKNFANLTDLLRSCSALNIRSYGLSGLSTVSFRGAGSSQSVVMWEGLNIQSPANGSLDLSQVPINFVDNISLQYGGGGAHFGTGTIGGVINLSSKVPPTSKPFHATLTQQLGSYGSQFTGINLGISKERYSLTIRGFDRRADNDFIYFNEYNQATEIRKNAQFDQKGGMIDGHYKIGKHHQVIAKYWQQKNHLQIPKTKAQGETKAVQRNYINRALVSWNYEKENLSTEVKLAYLRSKLVYDNKLNIFSVSLTESKIAEGKLEYSLSSLWKLQAGINYTREEAKVDGYGSKRPLRHRIAAFSTLKGLLFDKLEATIAVREALNQQVWSPFLPSIGLNYTLSRQIAVKARAAKSYRIPTFNDLYWSPGGNPNLRPEASTSIELGVAHSVENDKIKLHNELTTYSNNVTNWIQWAPLSSGLWTPRNLHEVWSRGIEVSSRAVFDIGKNEKIEYGIGYQYTRTTTEKTITKIENLVGNQLMYVPKDQVSLTFRWTKNKSSIGVRGNYTGEQFTDEADNRGVLEDFLVWDMTASHQFPMFKNHSLRLGIELNNIFDLRYDIRGGYPMPRRNYNLSISYGFNK